MKIFEVLENTYPNFPIFAWLEPSRGPENISGVRLAYIEPTKARQEYNLSQATAANDERWIGNVKRMGDSISKSGQKFYTPDLGWWDSEEAFYAGQSGFGGETFEKIQSKYPNIQVLKSHEEAAAAAQQAGIV